MCRAVKIRLNEFAFVFSFCSQACVLIQKLAKKSRLMKFVYNNLMRRKQGKLLTPSSFVGQSLFFTPYFDCFLTTNFIGHLLSKILLYFLAPTLILRLIFMGRLLSKILLYLLAPTLILTLIFMGRVLSTICGGEFVYIF